MPPLGEKVGGVWRGRKMGIETRFGEQRGETIKTNKRGAE